MCDQWHPRCGVAGGGPGNISVDPAMTAGYLLTSGSPCVGAGTNMPWTATGTDINGDDRTNGIPDIGADEFTDTDGDGLDDGWERVFFNTLDEDADGDPDGDGIANGTEYTSGSDPTSAASAGCGDKITLRIMFGDSSDSDSEKYRVVIKEGANTVKMYENTNYGETETFTCQLPKGHEYTLALEHVATDPDSKF